MKHKLFRGLGAILFKEFIVVARDPLTLFFFFFPPLIEMIAFGYALDNDVKHMAMLVLNEDRTVESRQLIDRFVNTESLRVVGEVQNLEQLKSEMRKGRGYAALDIPPNFTRELLAGRSAQVQLLVDGSNSTTALQALQTGLGVALTQSLESLLRETGRQGMPVDVASNALQPGHARTELFCAWRDRSRFADWDNSCRRHGPGARTGARHTRAIAG